ncbi:MAG: hypothetical protein IKC26_00605 [Clostridia bacterium]|nr:hypothetical protein [Clostridia bacterium]
MKKILVVFALACLLILASASCGHKHEWIDATCTAPQTCGLCGQTEGAASEHAYSAGICTLCGSEDPVCIAKYGEASDLLARGEYSAAYTLLSELGDYKDAEELVGNFHYIPTGIRFDAPEGLHTLQILYDERNFPTQLVTTRFDDAERITERTYDENGNLIKMVLTPFEGIQSIYEYTYDANGNMTHMTTATPDGIKSVTSYTYDESGNLTVLVSKHHDGTENVNHYTYDENGNPQKEIYTSHKGDEFIYNLVYDYVYDKDGALIKATSTYYYSDNTIGHSYSHEYTYNERGDWIRLVTTTLSPSSLTKEVTTVTSYSYTYDENGRILKKSYASNDVSTHVYEYVYDENGNLITEVCSIVKTTATKTFVSFCYTLDYTYDENGNLIRKSYMDTDDFTETVECEYQFVYMPQGLPDGIESFLPTLMKTTSLHIRSQSRDFWYNYIRVKDQQK